MRTVIASAVLFSESFSLFFKPLYSQIKNNSSYGREENDRERESRIDYRDDSAHA